MLKASLQLCNANLFNTTPSSVYIFTAEDQAESLRKRLGARWMLPHVAVLPIPNSSWVAPLMAHNQSEWETRHPRSYRLMGDWRLSFLPVFARSMGHRYVLQLDDDSYILNPVGLNLVELFDSRGYLLAARRILTDHLVVTWGLPELTRYFLLTHKVVPTTLFEHCDPPNINGLRSAYSVDVLRRAVPAPQMGALEQMGMKEGGGWDRSMLNGNCVMYSLEWRFRPEVDRFVEICRTSGGAFDYRWNEQGVFAMLWQIFVTKEQFYMFDFMYEHRRAGADALKIAKLIKAGLNYTSPNPAHEYQPPPPRASGAR